MLKLIKGELFKIFHKKSTIITLFIIFLLVILVNYLYTSDYNGKVIYGDESYIKELEERLANFDFNNQSKGEYAQILASLEIEKYVLGKTNDWQTEKYYRYVSDEVYDYYNTLYVLNNEEEALKLRNEIDEVIKKLDNNDWSYFVNQEKKQIEEDLNNLNNYGINNPDYAKNKEIYEYQLYLLNYRLNNNVSYEDSYLNEAIVEQEFLINDKINYEKETKEVLKDNYKDSYKQFKENEYILENKKDTNNSQSLRGLLVNFFEEYTILILIFVIMIAGSSVSEEFSKGTIKSLLTIPYKRSKILLAKYLSVLMMIPFIVGFILLCELVIGALFFNFQTLSIPVIGYNFSLGQVEVLSLAKYFILKFLTILPMLILITTLAFSLSTLLLSTAFAITLSLCGFFGSSLINSLIETFKIKFLYYFVTPNWDLSYTLFGGTSIYGIPLGKSIIICLVYLIIMIIISFKVFKKRNIKNI